MKQLLKVFPCLVFLLLLTLGLFAQYTAVASGNYSAYEYLPPSGINTLSAAPVNKKINLEWSVPAFTQASTYIIERSLDGEHFEIIGSDATAISDGAKRNFTFTDRPGGKTFQQQDIFYRVGRLNDNNEYQYTKPLLVRRNHTGNVDFITILPHPVDNNITMTIGVQENSFIVAKITNEQGQEIMNRKDKIIAGTQEFALAGTNKLSPGTYWLEVIVNGKKAMNLKLLKE